MEAPIYGLLVTVTDKCHWEIQFGQFNIISRLINTKVFS